MLLSLLLLQTHLVPYESDEYLRRRPHDLGRPEVLVCVVPVAPEPVPDLLDGLVLHRGGLVQGAADAGGAVELW